MQPIAPVVSKNLSSVPIHMNIFEGAPQQFQNQIPIVPQQINFQTFQQRPVHDKAQPIGKVYCFFLAKNSHY